MNTINNSVLGNLNAVTAIAIALNEQRLAGDDVARNVEIVAQIVEENTSVQSGISQSAKALQQLGSEMYALTRKFSV
jgi:methyl-accepting chemotaxis protein